MATIEQTSEQPQAPAPHYPKRRSLHKVAAWTLFGTLSYAGSTALNLTVLAKLGSVEIVGDFALALAVAAPITALGRLGMRPLVATETRHELTFHDYLAVQLLTVPICLSILAIIAVTGHFLPGVAWSTSVAFTIMTLGCAKLTESTSTVFFGLMDRHERQKFIARSMCIKGVGGVASVALAFWLSHSTAIAGAALATWWLLTLLFADVPLAVKLCRMDGHDGPLLRWPGWRKIRRVAAVCGAVGFTAAIREFNLDLPAYFVRTMLGPAAMGYYAGVSAVNKLSRIIFRSFNQAASPRLAQYFHQKPAAFVRLTGKMLLMCATLGIAAVIGSLSFGGLVLSLLYRPEYAAYKSTLVLLSVEVAFGLGAVALRQSMIAARYLKSQIPQVLMTTAVLAGACMLLVPHYGLNGVAGSCVVASVFDLLTGLFSLTFLYKRQREADQQAAAAASLSN